MSDQQGKSESGFVEIGDLISEKRLTRRDVLKGAAALGAVAALGPLASACGGATTPADSASPSAAAGAKKGGTLNVGIVGGSAKDTADPQLAAYEPDIAIQYIMYEGLTTFDLEPRSSTRWPRRSSPTPTAPSGRSS